MRCFHFFPVTRIARGWFELSLPFSFSQVERDLEEINARFKEHEATRQQLNDDVDKVKSLSSKETRAVDQQNQQNDRLNEEIRNVLNLIAFEEAKLTKGQIDE